MIMFSNLNNFPAISTFPVRELVFMNKANSIFYFILKRKIRYCF